MNSARRARPWQPVIARQTDRIPRYTHHGYTPGLVPEIDAHLESKKCFGLHERNRERETQARKLATVNSPLRCPSGISNYHQNTATVFSIDQHRYSQSKRIYITGVSVHRCDNPKTWCASGLTVKYCQHLEGYGTFALHFLHQKASIE